MQSAKGEGFDLQNNSSFECTIIIYGESEIYNHNAILNYR